MSGWSLIFKFLKVSSPGGKKRKKIMELVRVGDIVKRILCTY